MDGRTYYNVDAKRIQSNLSHPDSCYPGTSLNRAADSLHFILILQKLWAAQWVWPIIAIMYSEIQTNLSYGHPLIPRHPDKRGFTVHCIVLAASCINSKLSTICTI